MNETEIGATLKELQKYGRPHLSCMKDGDWYSSIEIFVTGQGINFKIQSEFDHPTPEDSLHELRQRVQQSLSELKNRPLLTE